MLSDPEQIREPFLSWRRITKLRDASLHYAKRKAEIWRSPKEWYDLTVLTADTCFECAREFWQACYPGRPYPRYLHDLDQEKHRNLAENRLRLEGKAESHIRPAGDAINPTQ